MNIGLEERLEIAVNMCFVPKWREGGFEVIHCLGRTVRCVEVVNVEHIRHHLVTGMSLLVREKRTCTREVLVASSSKCSHG